ncbi:unnamed protein product [Diabrotica balteata]|uniref:Uncharacterized protein n=1 Tax=Diabrotica balteata TaxID=107213 RepID=A0A9N9X9J4_DIABA|nr:unnamed protein product [Diabrotica balteata]
MGTEYKHADINMDDSGNSCGSSVVSDYSGPSYADVDGVQVSDIENDTDSHVLQVGKKFITNPWGYFSNSLAQRICFEIGVCGKVG